MALNVACRWTDRADQRPRRFDLCAAARGAGRGHALSYYTPDRMAMVRDGVFATTQPLNVRDKAGIILPLAMASARRCRVRCRAAAAGPPFDLNYTPPRICCSASIQNAGGQRSGFGAQCPGEDVRHRISGADAADLADRDLAEIKAFRAEHGDIVMKPLYGHGGGAVFPG